MLEKCTQTLIQHKEGICFSAPFGKNISDGTKQLIIKSKLFKKEVDKLLYLIQDNLCYGIIKLKYPFKITSKEFKELEPKHGISEDEYKRWWP